MNEIRDRLIVVTVLVTDHSKPATKKTRVPHPAYLLCKQNRPNLFTRLRFGLGHLNITHLIISIKLFGIL